MRAITRNRHMNTCEKTLCILRAFPWVLLYSSRFALDSKTQVNEFWVCCSGGGFDDSEDHLSGQRVNTGPMGKLLVIQELEAMQSLESKLPES